LRRPWHWLRPCKIDHNALKPRHATSGQPPYACQMRVYHLRTLKSRPRSAARQYSSKPPPSGPPQWQRNVRLVRKPAPQPAIDAGAPLYVVLAPPGVLSRLRAWQVRSVRCAKGTSKSGNLAILNGLSAPFIQRRTCQHPGVAEQSSRIRSQTDNRCSEESQRGGERWLSHC
jgi:hypothetical protein